MGSNGFSSERKQKRVDLLKQLLDTNISTQGSSNPLEALLSGLDLGSLEGLMQKNKKSHHDDWDSKKKRHHDDCSDHDWDHKKKHDHDDCGCKKKKHDHDDCGCKKKKHNHDDCGCKDHKHHKDPCDKCFKHDCCCKKKNRRRCKCEPGVKNMICSLIEEIFAVLDTASAGTLLDFLDNDLRNLLDDCKIPQKLLDELDRLVEELEEITPPTTKPSAALLEEIEEFLEDLLKCLGFRRGECGEDGGVVTCNGCGANVQSLLCPLITPVANTIRTSTNAQLIGNVTFAGALAALRNAVEITACIRGRGGVVAHLNTLIGDVFTPGGGMSFTAHLNNVIRDINDLITCLACNIQLVPLRTLGTLIPERPLEPLSPEVSTVRERLLDLLADQVVITTPTGLYAGTLVAVEADYIAVVAPTGTYLIPLDQIQTFTTE
ncbi:hypothetical protein [Priestia megaterium]|uniref:hypothetical protein n=1 Tax=Priestia megaterium TaxID=1404 RepID=UPI00298CE275|nr:hypothetical protein [Priestia megaterium]